MFGLNKGWIRGKILTPQSSMTVMGDGGSALSVNPRDTLEYLYVKPSPQSKEKCLRYFKILEEDLIVWKEYPWDRSFCSDFKA